MVLDVYAHDSLNNRYSIEIQNDNRKNDVKRVRYIQGSVDTHTLNKETGLPLDNGVHEIYLNLRNISDNSSVRELQEYMLNSKPGYEGTAIKELAKRVTYLKNDEGGIEKVCAICDEIRAEGIKEGKAEGIKEGKAEGIKANVLMCKNLGLSMNKAIEELQKAYNISENEAVKCVEMYW